MKLRKFGPYPYYSEGIPTVEVSYEDGYNTGATWSEAYNPGGPCVYGPGQNTDEQWIAYCAALRENYDAWHRGFEDARRNCKKEKAS